jgi:hypothetical protein
MIGFVIILFLQKAFGQYSLQPEFLVSQGDIREPSGFPAESDPVAPASIAVRQRNRVSFLIYDTRRPRPANQADEHRVSDLFNI